MIEVPTVSPAFDGKLQLKLERIARFSHPALGPGEGALARHRPVLRICRSTELADIYDFTADVSTRSPRAGIEAPTSIRKMEQQVTTVVLAISYEWRRTMIPALLLWLLGVPGVLLILLLLFGVL
jgi:hypothetical protein